MNDTRHLQRYIKIARVRKGISQATLAKKLHYSTAAISSWESERRGKRGDLPWKELCDILPELEIMLKQGCKAVCNLTRLCEVSKCPYLKRHGHTVKD